MFRVTCILVEKQSNKGISKTHDSEQHKQMIVINPNVVYDNKAGNSIPK